MVVDGVCRPLDISVHVAGPFLTKNRTIWLRVLFIRMFDMETNCQSIDEDAAVDGSTAAGYAVRSLDGRDMQ